MIYVSSKKTPLTMIFICYDTKEGFYDSSTSNLR